MLSRYGSPSVNDLYTISNFFPGAEKRTMIFFLIGLAVGSIAMKVLALTGLAAMGLLALSGFVLVCVLAPLNSILILQGIERKSGNGSASKVVRWIQTAKDGDLFDLDQIVRRQ